MKHVFSLILFFLSVTTCSAQRVTFNKGGTTSENYYEVIPFEFVNGYIFVTPEINGVKRKFLFDTGAPVQITNELFAELKPGVINHTEITDAAGNKDDLNIVALKEIKLGGLSFTGIPALVANSDIYTCFHIEGIVGSNMLRNSIVRIDLAKRLIILTDDETKLPLLNKKEACALTVGEPQSFPYFNINIGATSTKTQVIGFDTGSPYFLVMAETHAKRYIKDRSFEKLSSGYGSSSRSLLGLQAKDSLYRLKLPLIALSGHTFTNVTTETNKSNKTRIGTKLLNYGIVTIDFKHSLFYFEPAAISDDMTEKLWPVKLIAANKKLIIGVVWEKLKDKISTGDQIVAIDDEPCETMELCDWLNGRSAQIMNRQTLTLTVKDEKGVVKKINIARE